MGWREKLYGNLIEGWLRVGIDLAVRFVELVFGLFFFLSRRRMQKIDWVWILCSVLIVIYSFHGFFLFLFFFLFFFFSQEW